MTTPYTYRIGWTEQDIHYYGVRYAKGCDPSELFVAYFTSSTYVAAFVEKHGPPDILEIRKTFGEADTTAARKYEHRVLKRIVGNPRWLNKSDNINQAPLYGDDNPSTKPENRAKISAGTLLNTPRGDEHPRRKNPEKWGDQSSMFKGRDNWWSKGELNAMNNPIHRANFDAALNSPETKKNRADANARQIGVPKPEVSAALKGVPKEKVTCPHCGKTGGKNTMGRWHFDNCKHKTS